MSNGMEVAVVGFGEDNHILDQAVAFMRATVQDDRERGIVILVNNKDAAMGMLSMAMAAHGVKTVTCTNVRELPVLPEAKLLPIVEEHRYVSGGGYYRGKGNGNGKDNAGLRMGSYNSRHRNSVKSGVKIKKRGW